MSDLLVRPRWLDAKGQYWDVKDMETRHLFYTLRMIWNNRMPVPVPDNPKFYRFDPRTHDEKYLAAMIPVLAGELSQRDDISPFFQSQLDWMEARFTELLEAES
jgi:hypothetical protein